MEKEIRKWIIYGFIIGLAGAILFVSYREVTILDGGVTQAVNLPMFEYVILLLRYGIIGAIIGLFVGLPFVKSKRKQER